MQITTEQIKKNEALLHDLKAIMLDNSTIVFVNSAGPDRPLKR